MKSWKWFVAAVMLLVSIVARAAPGSPEEVRFVQEGTSTNSATGTSLPIYAVIIGAAQESEQSAFAFRQLGPYSLDAAIWVPLGADGWKRTEYRRPASAEEWAAFPEAPVTFKSEVLGRTDILPSPFNALSPAELEKVEYLIAFRRGGVKVVLKRMVRQEAEDFLQAVLALTGQNLR
ncbi:MAG TPA: hypothetical protein VJO34_16515 [Methylomirabilota bacterium]|nr:hypothetical protein [Methylomirabilota bacterium]